MYKTIYCCGCSTKVEARLTSCKEIYPHRPDLKDIPMWICDTCKNFVGCHHKRREGKNAPLGCIPTPAIRDFRKRIHAVIDPLWKAEWISRGALYARIAKQKGVKSFHTGNIRTVEEAKETLAICLRIHGALVNTVT